MRWFLSTVGKRYLFFFARRVTFGLGFVDAVERPIQIGRDLEAHLLRRGKAQSARFDGGLDVVEKVLHDGAAVALFEADLDGIFVPRAVRAAEREQPLA